MRCRRIALVLPLILFALLPGAGAARADSVPRMDVAELRVLLGNPELTVIDVRTEPDWQASATKIKGAVRQDPVNVDGWAPGYPKSRRIVLYCA